MNPRICSSLRTLSLVSIVLLTAIPGLAQSNSLARAVRLSFVEGEVTLQRPDVQGWAEAPVNTPLQEGFQLSTGENSLRRYSLKTAARSAGEAHAPRFHAIGTGS